jgi:hypothetical protein
MKTFSNNEKLTFTKNYTTILACKKLCPTDKLIIARVLNWQQSELTCTLSNNALADELGISLNTLKGAITRLNKTPFFDSKEDSDYNEYGKWSNSKEIKIDEELLFDFISINEIKKSRKIKNTSKPKPIQPEKEINQPIESDLIIVKYEDKGDVLKIEDFNIELPEPTNINYLFEGEILKEKAYLLNGKYYLVDSFKSQKTYNEREIIILDGQE